MEIREPEFCIVRSQKRSAHFGISEVGGKPVIRYSNDQVNDLLTDNSTLVRIASSYVKSLIPVIFASDFSFILCDRDGFILELYADENQLPYLNRCGLDIGVSMNERSIGTTAIGVSIFEEQAIQTSGIDHTVKGLQAYSCSAAPVFNVENEVIGVLALLGDKNIEHNHTLGLVISAAKAIQNRMESEQVQKRLFDAQHYAFSMMNQLSFGVFAVDLEDQIIWANNTACRAINIRRSLLINSNVDRILPQWSKLKKKILKGKSVLDQEMSFDIPEIKERFLINAYLIKSQEGEIIGYQISLRPFKRFLGLVNKYAGLLAGFKFEDIITQSPKMIKVMDYARTVAGSPSSILLTGESGTGKEVFAQAIHNASDRKNAGFVAINCGAISASLIESELFGYEEGAFTGALKGGKPGKFELANGGTLFLDEMGEMQMDMQVKLLRALQDRQITRVGGSKMIPLDVRIIAATNKNLEQEVKAGKFRLDLFYRINVITIELPPLRKRKDDIPLLAHHFLQVKADKMQKPMVRLSRTMLKEINAYNWPGNVRELENYIEKVTILNSMISIQEHISGEISSEKDSADEEVEFVPKTILEAEKDLIIQTYKALNGNMSKIAKALGIGRNTLYQKVKRLDIELEKM
jgi:transcriptional regulator with PAS, ATPase and Fis domain